MASTDSATDIDDFTKRVLHEKSSLPYAGRIGGNVEFILDRNDPANARTLEQTPDAAPFVSPKDAFDLRGFKDLDLYRAGIIEGFGTWMISYVTIFIGLIYPADKLPV